MHENVPIGCLEKVMSFLFSEHDLALEPAVKQGRAG